MSKRAVFLDRDGTIIDDTGFIRRVEDVKLVTQSARAIARLNAAGWTVVVVTNQSGVARGLLTEKDVAATNERMGDLLKKEGAHVDAIYYCPHLPEGKVSEYSIVCECRKPRPGMILRAAKDLDIDLAKSVMIGDSPRDVEAGLAAGARAILLTSSAARAEQAPDACGQASDLGSAVEEILQLSAESSAAIKSQVPSQQVSGQRKDNAAGAVEPPPVEAAKSEEAKPEIPIHRAPKEFVPEPEPAKQAPAKPSKPAPAPEVAMSTPPAVKKASSSAASPDTSGCGRCGKAVHAGDVEAGRAFNKDGVCLCEECVALLKTRKTRAKDVNNEELLRELQNITRALVSERFSYWHIFGAIAQALAVGSLAITVSRHATPEGLLWAIFLQLLALTLFILGRR